MLELSIVIRIAILVAEVCSLTCLQYRCWLSCVLGSMPNSVVAIYIVGNLISAYFRNIDNEVLFLSAETVHWNCIKS